MKVGLNPEQNEKLKQMVGIIGSSNTEIKAYFKVTYQIELPAWKIDNLRYKMKKAAQNPGEIKPTRKYTRRLQNVVEVKEPFQDDLMNSVNELDSELKKFCGAVRRIARREIVKYIARIRKARNTMGEVITKEESERLEKQLTELDINPKEIDNAGL